MKSRIIEIHKPNCYKYYQVEEQFLYLFWINISWRFDTRKEAEDYIKIRQLKEIRRIVS